jgi:hypothetical protein
MSPKKKSSGRKYGKAAQKRVRSAQTQTRHAALRQRRQGRKGEESQASDRDWFVGGAQKGCESPVAKEGGLKYCVA